MSVNFQFSSKLVSEKKVWFLGVLESLELEMRIYKLVLNAYINVFYFYLSYYTS